MNDSQIIELALTEYLVTLVTRKKDMIDKSYNKKTKRYCFTMDELLSLLEIQETKTKTKNLISSMQKNQDL